MERPGPPFCSVETALVGLCRVTMRNAGLEMEAILHDYPHINVACSTSYADGNDILRYV